MTRKTSTFSNLVILHTRTYAPMKVEQTECYETSVYIIQTPGNYPEENIRVELKIDRGLAASS